MADDAVTKDMLEVALTAMAGGLLSHMDVMETRLREHLDERIEKIETTLLTEFHKYARASEVRTGTLEIGYSGLIARMAAVESRVRELEAKNAGL